MNAVEKIFLKHGKLVKASPEDKLLVRGAVSKNVYFVKSGQVLLHTTSHDGREVGFDVMQAGHVFGFASWIVSRAFLDATALTACDLLVIRIDALDQALKEDITATLELLRYMTVQLFSRTRQAEGLALYTLRGRLARWLILLARAQEEQSGPGIAVHLEFNQKLIAAMTGASRETVNRQLQNWIRAGIIGVEGKKLTIFRRDALAALAAPIDEIPVAESNFSHV